MERLEVPETGRNTYSDTGLKGLQVRVYPAGGRLFPCI
jgi:hypothetical protein